MPKRYIDADQLKKQLDNKVLPKDNGAKANYVAGFKDALERFKSMIHSATTADVQEVKHGEWDEMRNAYGDLEGWLCKCGREVKCKEKFCPDCGLKMDGNEIGGVKKMPKRYIDENEILH